MEGFCPSSREGAGAGALWGEGREVGGGGGAVRSEAGGEASYIFRRRAERREREIKQMEFVLKNGTITLFGALQKQKERKKTWKQRKGRSLLGAQEFLSN